MADRRPKLRLVGAAERAPRPDPARRRYVSVPVDARLWAELGFIALADGMRVGRLMEREVRETAARRLAADPGMALAVASALAYQAETKAADARRGR